MEHFNRKYIWFYLPIVLVELATFINLTTYYHYHEVGISAVLLAFAFSVMLIGTSQLMLDKVPIVVKILCFIGGCAIFYAQARANISEAFIRGERFLPAEQLVKLWGGTPDELIAQSAIIFSGVINFTGLVYWIAIGFKIQHDKNERELTKNMDDVIKEVMK